MRSGREGDFLKLASPLALQPECIFDLLSVQELAKATWHSAQVQAACGYYGGYCLVALLAGSLARRNDSRVRSLSNAAIIGQSNHSLFVVLLDSRNLALDSRFNDPIAVRNAFLGKLRATHKETARTIWL